MTDENENPPKPPQSAAPAAPAQQAIAIDQALAQDIIKLLRKLPMEDAESTVLRLQSAQLVTLQPPE